MMGLEEQAASGVQTDDIKSILQGHVKNGYTVSSLLIIIILQFFCIV